MFTLIQEEAKKHFTEIKDKNDNNILIGMATCGLASGALEVKSGI